MTDDLAAFVSARLDEDEAAAKAATPGPWTDAGDTREAIVEQLATTADTPASVLHMIAEMYVCEDHEDRRLADAEHIARHDPDRVLREVQAKRAILTAYIKVDAARQPREDWIGLRFAVETLAAVWSGHADYRAEWKP